MAGMSQNSIKSRIKSVDSTRQITKAMELVATSKLRRAKEKAEGSRPFHFALTDAMADILKFAKDIESPYLVERKVKKTCFIVIAGDRGLAGGYNNNVFKAVKALTEQTPSYCILPIGKKAIEYYSRRNVDIIDAGYETIASVGAGGATDIASLLCREYAEGKIDRVVTVYTEFVSMLTQQTSSEQILPLSIPEKDGNLGGAVFDSSADEMIEYLVPFCVSGLLYSSLCEAEASEHGSRRNAMNSANKNADEIIASLRLSYNRARQAAITQEITEIVSGAEAL